MNTRKHTILEKIYQDYIVSRGYKALRPMKKWSDRYRFEDRHQKIKSPNHKRLIRKIRDLLNLISGDDLIEMIKGTKYFLIKIN